MNEAEDQRAPKRPRTEEETVLQFVEAKDIKDERTRKRVLGWKDWPTTQFKFEYKNESLTGNAICTEQSCRQKSFVCEGGGSKIAKDKSK